MKIEREVGRDQNSALIAQQIEAISGPCIGCKDCQGLCVELIDAVLVPGLVIRKNRDAHTGL